MSESRADYHEAASDLTHDTRNAHRAIVSLIEEFEAVDWYLQRAEACDDEALEAVLRHNMNEEMEHAMMCLEWLRRRLPRLDEMAHAILFREGTIASTDGAAERKPEPGHAGPAGSGLGLLGAR